MLKINSLRILRISGILSLLLGTLAVFGQAQIDGRVVSSEDAEGLPGATVMIKGSAAGTITDFDGRFSLTAAQGEILIITYVGFIAQEVVVGTSDIINIT
ncbi:MAG: hypothetical protein ACJA08_002775, partial [Cyclobacteriaceae bacterium]